MSTYWRSVSNKCIKCGVSVGKISIKSGKINVDKYNDHWGCWKKVPGQSEMQVLCCTCQKYITKLENKRLKMKN